MITEAELLAHLRTIDHTTYAAATVLLRRPDLGDLDALGVVLTRGVVEGC